MFVSWYKPLSCVAKSNTDVLTPCMFIRLSECEIWFVYVHREIKRKYTRCEIFSLNVAIKYLHVAWNGRIRRNPLIILIHMELVLKLLIHEIMPVLDIFVIFLLLHFFCILPRCLRRLVDLFNPALAVHYSCLWSKQSLWTLMRFHTLAGWSSKPVAAHTRWEFSFLMFVYRVRALWNIHGLVGQGNSDCATNASKYKCTFWGCPDSRVV